MEAEGKQKKVEFALKNQRSDKEVAQWLSALVPFAEDKGSVRTHRVAHNHL